MIENIPLAMLFSRQLLPQNREEGRLVPVRALPVTITPEYDGKVEKLWNLLMAAAAAAPQYHDRHLPDSLLRRLPRRPGCAPCRPKQHHELGAPREGN